MIKALALIAIFVSVTFIRNLAFWSPERTYIFGDTAIYSLQLATLAKNLPGFFSPKISLLGWNPNFLSVGLPALSIVDAGYLYPPHWISAVLTRLTGDPMIVFPLYTISLILHIIASSFFIYKILKELLNLSNFASITGGLIWSFSGFNSEFAAAGPIMIAGSYLPLCTYLAIKLAREKRRLFFFLYYVSLAFSFLAGYPMVSLLVYTGSTVFKLFSENDQRLTRESLWKECKDQALGLLTITLPLIAPLYLQSYLSLPYTTRSPLKLEAFLQNPVPLLNIPEPLLPKNTLFNTLSSINYIYLYLSLVGLIIICQAPFVTELLSSKIGKTTIIFGLLGLITSLGNVTFLPTLIYYSLPFLNVFRRLSVFTLIPSFCFSILVAGKVDAFLQSRTLSKISAFWLKTLTVLIIYSQVLNLLYSDVKDKNPFNFTYLYQGLFFATLISLVSYFSILYARDSLRLAQAALFAALLLEAGTNVASKVYLNSQIDPSRIFRPNNLITTLQKMTKPTERVDVLRTQHSYNTEFLDLEQTQGYLSLASWYGVEINEALNNPEYRKNNLRNIVGVKYIVSKNRIDDPTLKEVAEIRQNKANPEFFVFNYMNLTWEKEDENAIYTVYQNESVLPRLYLADSIKTTVSQTKDLLKEIELLNSPRTVILSQNTPQSKEISGDGTIILEEYKRNYIRAKIGNNNTVFLANSTGYYPGWWIRVNDKIISPIQTNWFMMGTFLAPGTNKVEFFYLPYGLIIGITYLLASSVFWLVCGPRMAKKGY